MKALKDLFLDQLADIHYAEQQIVKTLPRLIKAATHEQLRNLFESHYQETEGQVTRLQRVFQAFGEKPRKQKCKAILGILKEGNELAGDFKGTPAVNAALVAAAQKIEHYEIATYGCLQEWANVLGNHTAARILEDILQEEKAADRGLTELARSLCNETADKGEGGNGDYGGHRMATRRGIRPARMRAVRT